MNPDAGEFTAAAGFAYNAAPQISSFSPSHGPAGALVTIQGSGFLDTPTVWFGAAASPSVAFVDGGEIVAAAPPNPPGTPLYITVTNRDGQWFSSDACVPVPLLFIYDANTPPSLGAVPTPQNVDEGELLQINLSAADPEAPPQVLTYSVLDAPANSSLDPATGVFTFTPDNTQGGSVYPVVFEVTDGGGGTDSQAVDIDVANTYGTGPGDISGPAPTLDPDGVVNVFDLMMVLSHWLMTPADGGWDSRCDPTGPAGVPDNVCDGFDLMEVSAYWGLDYR